MSRGLFKLFKLAERVGFFGKCKRAAGGAALAGCLLAGLVGAGCDRGEAAGGFSSDGDEATSTTLQLAGKGAGRREFTVPVSAERVVRRSVVSYVSTIGSIAPIETAPVVADAAGRLTFTQAWQPDDPVQVGDIIATIDDEDVQAEIEIAQGALDNAKAAEKLAHSQLAQAEEDMQITWELVSKQLQPKRELNSARMRIHTAENSLEHGINQVRRAELDLERARDKLEDYVIVAPMTGILCPRDDIGRGEARAHIVNRREITDLEGRMVATGATVCGVLDLTQVVARADVTSKDIGEIRIGAEAKCKVYMGDRDTNVVGIVSDISLVMNAETRAFQVDILIENPDGRLRPGMFSRLDIVTDIARDSIAAPRRAFQRRNNQDVVFVVDENGYSDMRAVKLGIENSEEVEVTEGLREGDLLIVMGQETLQDNVRVEIMNTDESTEDGEP